MKSISSVFFLFFLFIGIFLSWADPLESPSSQIIDQPIGVNTIDFQGTGAINPFFLEARIEATIKEGQEFPGLTELEEALEEAKQILINLRIFNEIHTEIQKDPESSSARIVFLIEETWNFLPLPIFMYDSNIGTVVGGILFWNNFLGTTTNLRTSYGYAPQSWFDLGEISIPVNSDFQFEISRIFFGNFNMKFNFRHWYKESKVKDGENLLLRYRYHQIVTGMNWRLGLDFGLDFLSFLKSVSYNQSLGYQENFGIDILEEYGEGPLPRTGPQTFFSHGLGWGKGNWIGNFRVAYGLGLTQGVYWNWEEDYLGQNYSLSANWSQAWDWFSLKTRITLHQGVQDPITGLGGRLRGVSDSLLFGQSALTFNLSTPLRVLSIPEVLEVQLWPFLDGGIATSWEGSFQNALGYGLDLVLFPEFAKSFVFRFTFGLDALNPKNDMEILMMDGLFF